MAPAFGPCYNTNKRSVGLEDAVIWIINDFELMSILVLENGIMNDSMIRF